MTKRRLRLIGAGGHARVAAEAWISSGGHIAGFHEDPPSGEQPVRMVAVAGSIEEAIAREELLHVAIGDNQARRRIASHLSADRFPPVRHDTAIISPAAGIGAGTLICAGAIVQIDAKIGRHTIINSGAIVEHDCAIGDFVHIAPGARLAGSVTVGDGVLIGVGAIILPGIVIGRGAVVGAGSVVLRNVGEGDVVVGNPAAKLR